LQEVPTQPAPLPPLPVGWQCAIDPASGRYFYAKPNGESTWDHPLLSVDANAAYAASVAKGATYAAPQAVPPREPEPAKAMTATELAHAKHAAEAQARLALQRKSIAQQEATYGSAGGGGSLTGYSVASNMATTDNGWDGDHVAGYHGDGMANAMMFAYAGCGGGYLF
jgi:hypothetical protein